MSLLTINVLCFKKTCLVCLVDFFILRMPVWLNVELQYPQCPATASNEEV